LRGFSSKLIKINNSTIHHFWGDGALYKDLLKNRNFTLLTFGGFISSIGDYLYNIGVTVYLYSATKSVGAVALMWLSRAVLRIPMLYLSGIIADSYNKKRVILLLI